MNRFENWYNKINEELENEPTVSVAADQEVADQPAVDSTSSRSDILDDCDRIMTSLETLAGELTEDLNEDIIVENELAYLGAAGAAVVAGLGIAAKKLFDITVAAPMARKKQSKVNSMSVKIAGIESSLASADKEQKDKITQKLTKAKEQRDELQTVINDRYSDAPKVVQRALASEKSKGKLEALNVIMGTADPEKKKEIAAAMADLKKSIAEDDQEFKKEAKSAKSAEISSEEQEKIDSAKDGKDSKEEQDETEETKEAPVKNSKEEQDETEETKEAPVKNSKKDKLNKVDDLIKKAEETGNDALLKKAKELKDKIEAKESWQITNTELGRLFEMEISTLEASLITEGLSVKDRFSKLL